MISSSCMQRLLLTKQVPRAVKAFFQRCQFGMQSSGLEALASQHKPAQQPNLHSELAASRFTGSAL
jgi:hypothetical protein